MEDEVRGLYAGASEVKKLTAPEIVGRKGGAKLAMLAAYDVLTARLAEAAGVDILLVGDSLGSVVLGYPSTVPVTMEEILHHTRAVVRGVQRTHVVADMPFMSFQVDDADAIRNAGRLIKEGGADSVKVEGGVAMADRVRAIVRAGIPVMGHVGLTPQSAGSLGGLRVQGNSPEAARALLDDATAVAEAGAFAMVIEVVPAALAAEISRRVPMPTIGIGAGAGCDGQVLVAADLLGLEDRIAPRYVKRYADLGAATREAFGRYVAEVRDGAFPADEHAYGIKPDVLDALRGERAGATVHD
jgi:3-methyl-2-oxobutanoate hydroxymethyltransferase